MIPVEYTRKARSDIFPDAIDSWGAYGYTLWLWLDDDVDPDVFMMAGADAQCTFVSVKWSVVLTSFGCVLKSLHERVPARAIAITPQFRSRYHLL